MSIFKKGQMRQAWVKSRDQAKDIIKKLKVGEDVKKKELAVIDTLGKAFGPHLDKVEDLLPKKATKLNDYMWAHEKALKQCGDYLQKVKGTGWSLNNESRDILMTVLSDIQKSLKEGDYKV